MLLKIFFISAGTICLFLGILGIFVPGLPTTPFLLLTAGLYARGNDRMYRWLVNNSFFGSYITQWQKTRGLTLRTKIKSVVLMCLMVSVSVIFMIDSTVVRIIVILSGLTGILVMGFIIPTSKNKLP
jgi:uncharacterized protein